MGDRMESSHDVDGEDVQAVLSFMDTVAHRCLDTSRLEKAQVLFLELKRTSKLNTAEEFVIASRSYTSLLADIFLAGSLQSAELEIREVLGRHAPSLRRLESKYTSPHCI
jgi:hypothetical protein